MSPDQTNKPAGSVDPDPAADPTLYVPVRSGDGWTVMHKRTGATMGAKEFWSRSEALAAAKARKLTHQTRGRTHGNQG